MWDVCRGQFSNIPTLSGNKNRLRATMKEGRVEEKKEKEVC